MEERVQLKLKPTTYIKYAVAVCAVAKHRMKVSSYSSLKVASAGRMLQVLLQLTRPPSLPLQPAVLGSNHLSRRLDHIYQISFFLEGGKSS